ncbi:MAG: hypothetical protein IIZ38_12930 [Sphingomonas sp.]|uniref:hypothetical protein n=1 Tax=Sphingomonas sp. TaxID=28214 RepID=UPI0025D3F71B|nr:hypothetical protein [Sphingomonas sp.]MBQ1499211.1 hypothetical protein [Sphingomonas sp.]
MLADGDPAWLVAWRDRDRQPAPSPPAKVYAPKDTFSFPAKEGADWQGMIVPKRWEFDGCLRREPVVDADASPPRVVRKMGWHRCLKCRRPFFSEDVLRLRLCDGAQGCREDEDRFTK